MSFGSVTKWGFIKTYSCGSSLETMGHIINKKHPTIIFVKYHIWIGYVGLRIKSKHDRWYMWEKPLLLIYSHDSINVIDMSGVAKKKTYIEFQHIDDY